MSLRAFLESYYNDRHYQTLTLALYTPLMDSTHAWTQWFILVYYLFHTGRHVLQRWFCWWNWSYSTIAREVTVVNSVEWWRRVDMQTDRQQANVMRAFPNGGFESTKWNFEYVCRVARVWGLCAPTHRGRSQKAKTGSETNNMWLASWMWQMPCVPRTSVPEALRLTLPPYLPHVVPVNMAVSHTTLQTDTPLRRVEVNIRRLPQFYTHMSFQTLPNTPKLVTENV